MPAAYSADIRGRVIARVESGSSRREAAEQFEVSPSSAIKWVAFYRASGSCAAKPRWMRSFASQAGDFRPPHSRLALLQASQDKRSKKTCAQAEQERADVAQARRRWMREQGLSNPAHLVFIDETAANTKMVRLSGRCAGRTLGRPGSEWPLENDHFRACSALQRNDGALCG